MCIKYKLVVISGGNGCYPEQVASLVGMCFIWLTVTIFMIKVHTFKTFKNVAKRGNSRPLLLLESC